MNPWSQFPSFARVFDAKNAAGASLYLALLGPSTDVAETISEIRRCVARSGNNLMAELIALFEQENWRLHLVAAVTLLVGRPTAQHLDILWGAVSSPSWVSPQLAATAWRLDPDFSTRAKALIAQRCAEDRQNMSQPGLPKLMSALARLSETHEVSPWRADIERIIQSDVDRGGEIAVHWIGAIEKFCSSSSEDS